MIITAGNAKLVNRICRSIIIAALAATALLFIVPAPIPAPVAVMPANHAFEVDPVHYLPLETLVSRKSDPFDVQTRRVLKRSFIVPEKRIERPVRSEPMVRPAPEPDIRGLRLLATSPEGPDPQAMIESTSRHGSRVLTVTIGDLVNDSIVVRITGQSIVLSREEQKKELFWDYPDQQEVNQLIQDSFPSNYFNTGKQNR